MQKTHSLHETSSRVSNKLPQLENGIIPESVQSSATCYTQMREVLSHKSSRRPRHPMMTGLHTKSYSWISMTSREPPSSTSLCFMN